MQKAIITGQWQALQRDKSETRKIDINNHLDIYSNDFYSAIWKNFLSDENTPA